MSIAIPPILTRNVEGAWAEAGRRWLAELPVLLDEVARDWHLTVGDPYALSYHWVTAVTLADGSPAVLKLGVPTGATGHLRQQAEAMRIFDGCGSVRLLAEDLARGALLLEQAVPGEPVAALVPDDDERATAALIEAGRRLHHPIPPGCTLPDLYEDERESFRDHLARYPAGNDPLPRHLVAAAADLFEQLCTSGAQRVVLHGDLHHDNLLRAEREPWLAIDPHGVVGDIGYDCGAMLFNPDPPHRDDRLLALVPSRIEQLADGYGLPVDRVLAWGFVMGVLSEVWTCQDGGTPGTRALDVATLLYPRLP